MGQSGRRPERVSDEALLHAKRIRGELIDLSYELPDESSRAILDAWTTTDAAFYELIRVMERSRGE